ncbi:MAG: hypothetical protein JWQ44_2865 [Chthoniobacter sp.]|nr:hypothetical protein [Chthoniobacter sp.]
MAIYAKLLVDGRSRMRRRHFASLNCAERQNQADQEEGMKAFGQMHGETEATDRILHSFGAGGSTTSGEANP